MKEILLTQGKVTLVDDTDFDWLNQWKWYAHRRKRRGVWVYYAMRMPPRTAVKRSCILMHRVILGNPKGLDVDHKNGDGLDNERKNLRAASRSENMSNRGRNRNNTSGYKGVSWHRQLGAWSAKIQVNGKHLSLGVHESKEKAAEAYDPAAKQYFGDFARINF